MTDQQAAPDVESFFLTLSFKAKYFSPHTLVVSCDDVRTLAQQYQSVIDAQASDLADLSSAGSTAMNALNGALLSVRHELAEAKSENDRLRGMVPKVVGVDLASGPDQHIEVVRCAKCEAILTSHDSACPNGCFGVEPSQQQAGCKCPSCGAQEVDAYTPRTIYACGSSDYDQRPGTFKQSEKCKGAES